MPKLSQNFLCDESVREKIFSILSPLPSETLLEIGPGKGFLTAPLSRKTSLIAIEKDPLLIPKLQKLPIELYHADILTFPLKTLSFTKIVSNIPYHITKPLLLTLQRNRHLFKKGVLMVQKEVADKLSHPLPNSFFVAIMQIYFSIQYEFTVKNSAFSPKPAVDSAVISLFPKRKEDISQETENLLQKLFQRQRKKIRTTLREEKSFLPDATILEKRPREVPIDVLVSYLESFS